MKSSRTEPDTDPFLYRALAEFRHQLRIFLMASENAAHEAGLHPQQHQLLLTVAGVPDEVCPSIAYAAELLGLKHNTVVELVDRCEQEGLLQRSTDSSDRRRVCLQITSRGRRILDQLSQAHVRELHSQAPCLMEALRKVLRTETKATRIPQSQESR